MPMIGHEIRPIAAETTAAPTRLGVRAKHKVTYVQTSGRNPNTMTKITMEP